MWEVVWFVDLKRCSRFFETRKEAEDFSDSICHDFITAIQWTRKDITKLGVE